MGRPATLKSAETKQIELLDVPNVPVERRYEFRSGETKVAVALRFKNAEETAKGLGIPLPKGPVRVFQRDADGELEFAGSDAIDHTPKDETLSLRLGYAFDLAGERKQLAQRNGFNWSEQDWEIKLRNHKPETRQDRRGRGHQRQFHELDHAEGEPGPHRPRREHAGVSRRAEGELRGDGDVHDPVSVVNQSQVARGFTPWRVDGIGKDPIP